MSPSPTVLKSAFRATGRDINRPSALLALIKLTLPSCRVETRSPLGAPVFPFQHQADTPEDRPQQEKLNAEHALPYAATGSNTSALQWMGYWRKRLSDDPFVVILVSPKQ